MQYDSLPLLSHLVDFTVT